MSEWVPVGERLPDRTHHFMWVTVNYLFDHFADKQKGVYEARFYPYSSGPMFCIPSYNATGYTKANNWKSDLVEITAWMIIEEPKPYNPND